MLTAAPCKHLAVNFVLCAIFFELCTYMCHLLFAQASCLASYKYGMHRWTEKASEKVSEKASKKDKLEKAGFFIVCLFVFLFLRFCHPLHYNSLYQTMCMHVLSSDMQLMDAHACTIF